MAWLFRANRMGEQPLLPYENCCLGSINLDHMVDDEGEIDWIELKEVTKVAVRFLNRVLAKTIFPIHECNEAMVRTRKIGVGIMGLHDLLIRLKIPYDSEEGRQVAGDVMKVIHETAMEESKRLAAIGLFSPADGTSGSRANLNVTSIAPTGTLSMLADCSYGCEPYYSPYAVKTVMDGHVVKMYNKHIQRIANEEGISAEEVLTKYSELFKPATEIPWESHVKMQAALQQHVDSGVSKTINMPQGTTPEEVFKAYSTAWKLGCKGLTVYVTGSRENQVFTSDTDQSENKKVSVSESLVTPWKLELPEVLDAHRYRVKDKKGRNVYFTVCHIDDQPVEVFAKLPEEESDIFWHTICRLLSLSMRYNVPLADIIKQLQRSSSSLVDEPASLARVLSKYLDEEDIDLLENKCPECDSLLYPDGGCWCCDNCGYSKCA